MSSAKPFKDLGATMKVLDFLSCWRIIILHVSSLSVCAKYKRQWNISQIYRNKRQYLQVSSLFPFLVTMASFCLVEEALREGNKNSREPHTLVWDGYSKELMLTVCRCIKTNVGWKVAVELEWYHVSGRDKMSGLFHNSLLVVWTLSFHYLNYLHACFHLCIIIIHIYI